MEENLTLAPGFDSYDLKNPALHEAGFDSYLTAWVFFHLPRREEYEGRINSAKSFYCMNLRAESDEIRRDVHQILLRLWCLQFRFQSIMPLCLWMS